MSARRTSAQAAGLHRVLQQGTHAATNRNGSANPFQELKISPVIALWSAVYMVQPTYF